MMSVLILWAVVPLAPTILGVDLNIGALYIIAAGAIGALSIIMAGWSSNNKYALIGAFRQVAVLVSFEIPMLTTLLIPTIFAGSMGMNAITQGQDVWYVFISPLGALIFLIAAIAELGRAPFDMGEAESELVAGYNIEYSGMKFALFFMAEYQKMIIVCAITAVFFFGGYLGPGVDQFPLLGPVYLFIKVVVLLFAMIWVRATWPRIRYDRLMEFGWKILVPLSLATVFITAAGILLAAQFNNNIFLWTIPVASVIVGLIPVIMIYRSLRRISYERA